MVAPYYKSSVCSISNRHFGHGGSTSPTKTVYAMQLFVYVNVKTPYNAQQKEKLKNAIIKLEVEASPLIVAVHIDPCAGLNVIPSHHDSKNSAPHGTDCADNLVAST